MKWFERAPTDGSMVVARQPGDRDERTHRMTSPTPHTWLVGHDGSDGAAHAVDWALAQAAGRDVELAILRTWQLQALEFPIPDVSIDAFAPTRACENIDEIVETGRANDIVVTSNVVRGPASQTLLDASEDASMLVVGSRGLGGFKRLLLGSVSSQCATHARVPTVVVPHSASTDRPVHRIVVGLDGSDRSQRALDWAIGFAPKDSVIRVVGAWMLSKSGFVAVTQRYTGELDEARDRFNEIMDAVESDAQATRFERRFAFADPATTLLKEGNEADLVVVGQRGHSGLSATVLGSVSTHVLHRSTVPVAVVPDGD